MTSIRESIAWAGGLTIQLSMFVVASDTKTIDCTMSNEVAQPLRVERWDLEDETNALPSRRAAEWDAMFTRVPEPLDAYVRACLHEALKNGAELAWFGFEGSFHFDLILDPSISHLVYAAADPTAMAVATDALIRDRSWQDTVRGFRLRLLPER